MLRTIQHNGENLTFSQWAEVLDMPKHRIKSRWDRGVRDPLILLHKDKFHLSSKWDYSQGKVPFCSTHKIKAVWHNNKARTKENRHLRRGQWSCVKCGSIKSKKSRMRNRNKFSYQLRIALQAARSRRECELSVQDLIDIWGSQKGLCAITGIPMQKTSGDNQHNRFKFSLDRIDNELPYLRKNVWLVCEFVNRAKSDLSLTELRMFAYGILHNFESLPKQAIVS